jgi:hypothetical protein
MDSSVRGRIWLIEFTNYLQKNPPKKTLVHDDTDLSSFDAWMIDCVQCYLNNADMLIGTPELTSDQQAEALKMAYGSDLVAVVLVASETIKKHGHIRVKDVLDELGITSADARVIGKFKECYERVTQKILSRVKKVIEGELVPIYREE